MSLHHLSASELARIDAICLDFESRLRLGQSPSIDQWVQRYGGEHAEELRRELELVRQELQNASRSPQSSRLQQMETDVETTGGAKEVAADQPGATLQLPTPGTRIGPYVISGELGRGGMGVVFAAIDTRLDRRVAIKVLAVETSKRKDLTERFQREARAIAALSHPNIVELFDVGVFNGLPYAVMEFLDGEPLDQRLSRGPMDATWVRRIGAQIADALATSHAAKVIHRDLKPQNVMLLPDRASEFSSTDASPSVDAESTREIAKLFDFGLSRAPDFSLSAEETGNGLIMGTPGYMSPEQVRGERVTPATDLFALGCILFEAFYGTRAFEGRTNSARFQATLHHEPAGDPDRRHNDPALADLISLLLRKEVEQRPQSASDIANQLRVHPSVSKSSDRARPTDQKRTVFTRRRLMLASAGGVCGGVLAVFVNQRRKRSLSSIRSLGVLSFLDESADAATPVHSTAAIGERDLERGERFAAAIVHELSRIADLSVPRYRPLVARSAEAYRETGNLLGVDAILTGSFRTAPQESAAAVTLQVQIVSSETGQQLWREQLQLESEDNLLPLRLLASRIASAMGRELRRPADEAASPSVESFNCLVSGMTRSDPDSPIGLESALTCFRKAHQDHRSVASPLAGIALTSITLAAQSDTAKCVELIRQSREAAEEALQLDPTSREARLALAMIDWQSLGRYRQAEQTFQELTSIHPNHWQVRHQYGLLLLATNRTEEAFQSLREAWQLHPLSMSVKVDHARAHWYAGDPQRAIQDAARLIDRYDDAMLARGLLIDLYEHQGRYDLAAGVDDHLDLPAEVSPERYLELRRHRLVDLPYGPFGTALNQAIWQARNPTGLTDADLADLTDPILPMLPLLLSRHPSFAKLRLLPRALEVLPTREA